MKYQSKNGKWQWDFFDHVPSYERFKVISKLKMKPLYLMAK